MIRKAEREDLPVCASVIRNSFQTVADEFGFTEENAGRIEESYSDHYPVYADVVLFP